MSDTKLIEAAKWELLCQRCSVEHPVWSVTNEVWNAVVQDGEHFFCPTCFIILAEERGIVTKGCWRMRTTESLTKTTEISTDPLERQQERCVNLLCTFSDKYHVPTDEFDEFLGELGKLAVETMVKFDVGLTAYKDRVTAALAGR